MRESGTEPKVKRLTTLTLLITNAIKVTGLGFALNEIFVQPRPRTLEILFSAFMMAGAQMSEETVIALWGRLFGGEHQEAPEEHRHHK